MKDDPMTQVTLAPAAAQTAPKSAAELAAQAALEALNESLAYYTPETPVVVSDRAETDYLPYSQAA